MKTNKYFLFMLVLIFGISSSITSLQNVPAEIEIKASKHDYERKFSAIEDTLIAVISDLMSDDLSPAMKDSNENVSIKWKQFPANSWSKKVRKLEAQNRGFSDTHFFLMLYKFGHNFRQVIICRREN